MNHKIQAVEPGSIAYQLGIQPGDELISINEQRVAAGSTIRLSAVRSKYAF